MKRKTKIRIKGFFLLLIFGVCVFTGGYYYLDSILNKTTVSENLSSVPYYTPKPENSTLLMEICEDKILLNFNFEEEIINVIFIENETNSYGYPIDFTLNSDYELIGYFIDLIGGIEIENQRFVGVQITQMLEYSSINQTLKKEIAEKIIIGISNSGFSKENLLYIIESSETDLKFSECFSWVEFIPSLCRFPRFVN